MKQAVAGARAERDDRTVASVLHADKCNNGAGVWAGVCRLNGGQGQRRGAGAAMQEGAGGSVVVEPPGIATTFCTAFTVGHRPCRICTGRRV